MTVVANQSIQSPPPVREIDSEAGSQHGPVGVRHALLMVTSPASVYRRVEDNGAYGWALITLLVLVTLIGFARIQTGLIDRDVDRQTEQAKAAAEKSLGSLVDRLQHRQRMEDIEKTATFNKLMMRLGAVVSAPVDFLTSFLLISSVAYAVVALTGRKPEFNTLMSICTYAGFIQLIGLALALAMMFYYRTTAVDTSLAGLGAAGEPTIWAGVDPFHIWFWVLVAIGLTVTRQLSRRMAIIMCSLLGLITVGIRIGLEFATAT